MPSWPMLLRGLVAAALLAGPCVPAGHAADEAEAAAERVYLDPGPALARDPAVRAELKITPEQRPQLDAFAAEINESLWAMRDLSPQSDLNAEATQFVGKFNRSANEKLQEILTPKQRERLEQIGLQFVGAQLLLRPAVASRLGLTKPQREKLDKLTTDALEKLQDLQKQATGNKDLPKWHRQVQDAQQALNRQRQAVLTTQQKARLSAMLGAPFDVQKVGPVTATTPELRGVAAWINTEPLRLEDLRGKVLVVHFWTFGCINCIHNYPSMKKWYDEFHDRRDWAMVGVHTPETPGEKNVDTIRAKAAENGLKFPIVVDNDQQIWKAWTTTMWPSTYLIDKQGRVRHWWYGELNWQGTEGEAYLHGKLRELLDE